LSISGIGGPPFKTMSTFDCKINTYTKILPMDVYVNGLTPNRKFPYILAFMPEDTRSIPSSLYIAVGKKYQPLPKGTENQSGRPFNSTQRRSAAYCGYRSWEKANFA